MENGRNHSPAKILKSSGSLGRDVQLDHPDSHRYRPDSLVENLRIDLKGPDGSIDVTCNQRMEWNLRRGRGIRFPVNSPGMMHRPFVPLYQFHLPSEHLPRKNVDSLESKTPDISNVHQKPQRFTILDKPGEGDFKVGLLQ